MASAAYRAQQGTVYSTSRTTRLYIYSTAWHRVGLENPRRSVVINIPCRVTKESATTNSDLSSQSSESKTEFKTKSTEFKTEFKTKSTEFKTEFKTESTEFKTEFSG